MKKEKAKNILFYTALTIELLILLIDKSALTNPIEGRLFQITFLLFFLKLCVTEYTPKEWIWIAVFEILGLISYMVTGRNEIIRIVTMIAACKDIDMRTVFSYMFKVVLTGCLLIVVLSMSGVLGSVNITGVFRGDQTETRYCLGMGHPNALHCMFFMILLLVMYLYGEKMRLYQFLAAFFLNIGMFMLTGSKTGTMVSAFAILFTMIMQYFPKLREMPTVYILTMVELAGCAFIAFWAAIHSRILPYYPNLRKFDRLLSDRIVNLYYNSEVHAGTLSTWTLWGVPENEYYFDLGWVRLFYWYGIIPACIYLAILFLLIRQLQKERDYRGLVILTSLFIYTLVEAHIISVYLARDYTLFLIGAYWTKMFGANKGNKGYFWNIARMILKKDE
ncbi:MAG: hypothetical protein MR992_02295 [Lachnospiraceae bacterium]|nr:hypothetical protein [Lachnospiraceae bacterium]MDD7628532.1 hypothetical protein [Lachnospiraceae bacterium]MDY4120058.1 hypothetical protein [Lachnospiraceae bacterium]